MRYIRVPVVRGGEVLMRYRVDWLDVTHVMMNYTATHATVCGRYVSRCTSYDSTPGMIGKFPTCLWCVAHTRTTRV